MGADNGRNRLRTAVSTIETISSIAPVLLPLRKEHVPVAVGDVPLAALIHLMQAGDQTALRLLYEATVHAVYSRARRITGNSADAEEVTSDVYQQVWRTAKQFEARRGSALQWLLIITRTRALDCCRSRRAQNRAHCSPDSESMSDPTVEHVAYEICVNSLRASLLHLNPVQARLIGLAFFDGLTHREIAESTQLPLGTVKSHLCRAIMVLRKAMASVHNAKESISVTHGTKLQKAPIGEGIVSVNAPSARARSGLSGAREARSSMGLVD